MICKNCGKELVDHAKFCAGCGQKIERDELPVEETAVNGMPEMEATLPFSEMPEMEEAENFGMPVGEAPVMAAEATVMGEEPVMAAEATVMGEAPFMAAEATVMGEMPAVDPEATVLDPMEMPMGEENPVYEEIEQQPRSMPQFMMDGLQEEGATVFTVEAPEKKKKKSKLGLIIGLVAAVLVLAAAAAAFFLFKDEIFGKGKDKNKEDAANAQPTGIVAQYPERPELFDTGLSDEALKLQEYSLDVDANLVDGYLIPTDLIGTGLHYTQDMSKPDREAGFYMEMTRGTESMDAQILIRDDVLYLKQEELLGQNVYGVNTETVGQDLGNVLAQAEAFGEMFPMPAELAGLSAYTGLGFNAFDLMSEAFDASGAPEKKSVFDSLVDLFGSVQKDEVGKEVLDVHGVNYECVKYDGVIPQEDAETILRDLADSTLGIDYEAFVETFVGGIGLPGDKETALINRIGVENPGMLGVEAWIGMFMNDIGDVELDLYYSGDYLMAVGYEKEVNGVSVKATLYISGEDYYGDELTLDVQVDGYNVKVHSVGNHAGVGDVLDDVTTITVSVGPLKVGTVTSEMRYAFKETENNFSWKVESKEFAINGVVEGNITIGDGAVELDLQNVFVEIGGYTAVEGSLRLRYANYDQRITETGKLVQDMQLPELLNFATQIGTGKKEFDKKLQEVVYGN